MSFQSITNLKTLVEQRPVFVAEALGITTGGSRNELIQRCLDEISRLGLIPEETDHSSPKLRAMNEGPTLKKVTSVTSGLWEMED